MVDRRSRRQARGFRRAPPRACCGRSSATSSSSATRTAARSARARCSSSTRAAAPATSISSTLARPTLDRLAEASGETVNLAVPSGGGVETVAQVDSGYILGATNWVGRQLVLQASALGKVFLAAGVAPIPATSSRRPLRPRSSTARPCSASSRSCASAATRRASRSSSRACSRSPPACASARARVIAALAISGPSIRLQQRNLDRLGTLLVVEADALSARLGYRQREEGAA